MQRFIKFFLSLTAPPAGLRDLFLCTWGRGCLETRAWLFPAFVERSKCLQSAVGHFRRLATPEPICAVRPPMGVISTTTGHFYGLLSSGSAEPGSDPAQCDSALPTGSQGEQMGIKPITSARLETCSTVEAAECHALINGAAKSLLYIFSSAYKYGIVLWDGVLDEVQDW